MCYRYKKMAEQHHKESKGGHSGTAKHAPKQDDHDSGYRFDLALCKKTFDTFDKDRSGYLDIKELTSLAEVRFLRCLISIADFSPLFFCRV